MRKKTVSILRNAHKPKNGYIMEAAAEGCWRINNIGKVQSNV